MPVGGPTLWAPSFAPASLPPHTHREPMPSTYFPVNRAKPAQTCYSITMIQNRAPLQDARNAHHHLWPGRICRTPRPRPAQPPTALSNGPKVTTQKPKGDICRLADDICHHKSTTNDAGNVLSRATAQMSCHERRKKVPEKVDIGRHWSTNVDFRYPLDTLSGHIDPAARQATVRPYRAQTGRVRACSFGSASAGPPIVVRPICAIIASDAS